MYMYVCMYWLRTLEFNPFMSEIFKIKIRKARNLSNFSRICSDKATEIG